MPDFTAKIHQIRFREWLSPRPRWGSSERSPDPLAKFREGYRCREELGTGRRLGKVGKWERERRELRKGSGGPGEGVERRGNGRVKGKVMEGGGEVKGWGGQGKGGDGEGKDELWWRIFRPCVQLPFDCDSNDSRIAVVTRQRKPTRSHYSATLSQVP